jgi:hypothetical protein
MKRFETFVSTSWGLDEGSEMHELGQHNGDARGATNAPEASTTEHVRPRKAIASAVTHSPRR